MMRTLMISTAVLAVSSATALAQDVAAGEQTFRMCLPCHSVGEGAMNKLGPVLNAVDGRKSGTFEAYNYSDGMKNAGITWNEATFKDYIQGPAAKVPGTKMAFAGLKDEKQIADLWAYLKQFKADGSTK